MSKIKRALISVSDKRGLVDFASALNEMGVEILSTGGTQKALEQGGIPVLSVSEYTGFPEMLDGRVKTLHPKIHAGLLALRDNPEHVRKMEEHNLGFIDLVVVNLYPFRETIAKPDVTLEDAVEQIDIGGPTMIRSGAKNFRHVAVVVNPDRYPDIVKELRESDGELSPETRYSLAKEVFEHTAGYDWAIACYLASEGKEPAAEGLPETLSLTATKVSDLRYGENPHQRAALYREEGVRGPSLATGTLLSGQPLSYINIMDMEAALSIVMNFKEPAAAVMKHANPCGGAVAESMPEAFKKAYLGDPLAAMGCVIGLNREVDAETAKTIVDVNAIFATEDPDTGKKRKRPWFVDGVVAPGYTDEALKVFTSRKGWGGTVRLVVVEDYEVGRGSALNFHRIYGGFLAQQFNCETYREADLKVVTKREPTEAERKDLFFAWVFCKHVKSNAIVYAKDQSLVGVGAGQMSRVDSSQIAAFKAGDRSQGAVMASDAFFPFRDGVDAAAEAGVTAVIQPGGSKRDEEVIATADEHGMAMIFTGLRHFLH